MQITELDVANPTPYLEVLSEDPASQQILERLGFPVSSSGFDQKLHAFPTWVKIFVAFNDSNPVGSVIVTGADNLKLRDAAIIADVRVKTNYRKRGIASELVRYTLDFIRSIGVRRVVTVVSEMNVPGIELYHKFGFKVFNALKDYYLPGENALALELELKLEPE